MKPRNLPFIAIVLALVCGASATAQMLVPQTSATTAVAPGGPSAGPHLTTEQLDQLLGPIALYPDALIALIFPSATVPSDVVLAARYLAGGDPAQIDDQSWDDSVKALAHYPDLVKWMDENLAWTKQVGEAFLDQPAEVMKSVQRLRAAARAAGTLVDTPQQQVVAEGETIAIVPTQPDVIYVPYYDPGIVYLPRRGYYPGSFFSFSVGYPVGFWLGYNLDWGHRRIWVVDRGDRERYWHDQRDWRRPAFPPAHAWTHDSVGRPWTPNLVHPRPVRPSYYSRGSTEIARPSPIALQTQRPPASRGYAPGSGRPDRTPGNRDSSRPSPGGVRGSGQGPAQNFQAEPAPAPAPAQVQAQTPAPAPARTSRPAPSSGISRGNHDPQSTSQDSGSRESRVRSAPVRSQSDAPASGRSMSAPASAPVSAPTPAPASSAPASTESRSVSRGSHASSSGGAAVASAPQAEAAPSSSSSSSSSTSSSSSAPSRNWSSRGGRGQGDRRD